MLGARLREAVLRFKAFRSKIRKDIIVRASEMALERSVQQARIVIKPRKPIRVLIDVTIRYHGITHETRWVSTEPKNSKHPPEFHSGYSARVPVHFVDDKTEIYDNVKSLPGIAKLAKEELISLYTSAELENEKFRQPSGRYRGYGYFDHDIFNRVEIPSIDGHRFPTIGPDWMNIPDTTSQQRDKLNASTDLMYKALVNLVGEKHSQDAWHLATAHRHDLFCFLTMDFKFRRLFENIRKNKSLSSLKTTVMTPKEFGDEFNIGQVDPYLLSYDDADCFVRTDIAMPDGKRRPLNQYKKH